MSSCFLEDEDQLHLVARHLQEISKEADEALLSLYQCSDQRTDAILRLHLQTALLSNKPHNPRLLSETALSSLYTF